jgi:hypothetical protein
VLELATGWKVRVSNPGGDEIHAPVRTCHGTHMAASSIGNMSLSRGKSGRVVDLTNHPHLTLRINRGTAIPRVVPMCVQWQRKGSL